MKNAVLTVFSGLLLTVAAGCSVATPSGPIRPAVPPLRKAEAAKIKARCAAIKKAIAPLAVRGIGLYPRAFNSGYSPESICKFIKSAGFNRIYFHISSETELDDRMKEFLAAAKKSGIPVMITVRQRDFYARHRGNRLLRNIRDEYPGLDGAVRHILQFNSTLPEECGKICGITVIMEPHRSTSENSVPGQRYAWSEKTFGPGLDNDLLMADTIETCRRLDTGSLPLTIAFPDFYHDLVKAGKLTCGKVDDFRNCRKPAPEILIMSSGNKPGQVVSGIREEISSVRSRSSILLGIELAGHVSISGDKLRRRDWRDLTRAVKYIVDYYKKYPEFRGVVISPLAVFEYLIMEQD